MNTPVSEFITSDFEQIKTILPSEKAATDSNDRPETLKNSLQVCDHIRKYVKGKNKKGTDSMVIFQELLEKLQNTRGSYLEPLLESPTLEELLGALSEIEEKLHGKLARLNPDEAVKKALQDCDLQNYWYAKMFNDVEQDLLKALFEMREGKKIRVLDLGSGTGRASHLAINAMKELKGEETARELAHELNAVDFMEKYVRATKEELIPLGVPEKNIHQADFRNLPPHLRSGRFDVVWALMNTFFYSTKEEEQVLMLKNISDALSWGGYLWFDTVDTGPVNEKVSSHESLAFSDLKNLYRVLILKFRQDMLNIFPAAPQKFCRFPIYDNTTGSGHFHMREVKTIEYMSYLISKHHIPLTLLTRDSIPVGGKDTLTDEQYAQLGLKWIEENGIKDWISQDIAYRNSQLGSSRNTPLYMERKFKIRDFIRPNLDINTNEIRSMLYDVAKEMVKSYKKLYYVFVKSRI